jgi:hypothetical protein
MSKKLLEAMKEFKIPQKLVGLVRATLKHVKFRARMESGPRTGRCLVVYFV